MSVRPALQRRLPLRQSRLTALDRSLALCQCAVDPRRLLLQRLSVTERGQDEDGGGASRAASLGRGSEEGDLGYGDEDLDDLDTPGGITGSPTLTTPQKGQIVKGPWTREEDEAVVAMVLTSGQKRSTLSKGWRYGGASAHYILASWGWYCATLPTLTMP